MQTVCKGSLPIPASHKRLDTRIKCVHGRQMSPSTPLWVGHIARQTVSAVGNVIVIIVIIIINLPFGNNEES